MPEPPAAIQISHVLRHDSNTFMSCLQATNCPTHEAVSDTLIKGYVHLGHSVTERAIKNNALMSCKQLWEGCCDATGNRLSGLKANHWKCRYYPTAWEIYISSNDLECSSLTLAAGLFLLAYGYWLLWLTETIMVPNKEAKVNMHLSSSRPQNITKAFAYLPWMGRGSQI